MEKLAEVEQRKSKEVAHINKQFEDSQKRIRNLEQTIENLRKKLDRKTEEYASLSKKMKDGGQLSSRISRSSLTHDSLKTMMSELDMRYLVIIVNFSKDLDQLHANNEFENQESIVKLVSILILISD